MEAEKDPHLAGGSGGRRAPPASGAGAAGTDAGQQSADEFLSQVDARCRAAATSAEGTVICINCGREGHPSCGMRYWTSLRSAWLRVKEEDVAREPSTFEDDGSLQQVTSNLTPIRDLSEGELEDLEDCLDAVQRPFPRLRRSVPLMQAVQCAESLWDTDD